MKSVILGLKLMIFITFSASVWAEESNRGQLLYENHCTVCHESNVHIRANSKANSLTELRYQIERWRKVLNLPWNEQEIVAVLTYLNETYYHHPGN